MDAFRRVHSRASNNPPSTVSLQGDALHSPSGAHRYIPDHPGVVPVHQYVQRVSHMPREGTVQGVAREESGASYFGREMEAVQAQRACKVKLHRRRPGSAVPVPRWPRKCHHAVSQTELRHLSILAVHQFRFLARYEQQQLRECPPVPQTLEGLQQR